jgi:hypothetical protein
MLESIVGLLVGLFLSTLILLVCAGILGSICAALRAVSRASNCEREEVKEIFALKSLCSTHSDFQNLSSR